MSDLRTLNHSDSLRELTYLQLCVVPAFIEPYLTRLAPSELKSTFFMFMQTFFEVNTDAPRINGFGEPISMLREYSRRPIGQQMIHLLKSTLAFYINKDYPLHTFFLEFESNTEPNMIHLQKALLNDLSVDSKYQTAINIILLSFDLTLEIYEIKRGNAKFLLNFSGKNENFQLQMETQNLRRKRCTEVAREAHNLLDQSNITENFRDFCNFCLQLAAKYQFVVLSKSDRQNKKQTERIELIIDENNEQQTVGDDYLETNDSKYWFLASESDSFEMISSNYINLLKDFSEGTLSSIQKLKNSALALIHRLTEARTEVEIQTRVNLYSLMIALKLLSGLKQKTSDKQKLAQTSQNLFKEVMQFQICQIKTTYYFLIAYFQFDIQQESLYNRIINFIGWVMNQYRKYNFKSQEIIYADFIASTMDLLVSWKQSSKPQEQQKQIEIVLNRLASKTKVHGQSSFGLFFKTLNTELLSFVSVCMLKTRGYSSSSPKNNEDSEHFDILLMNFKEELSQYITYFTFQQIKQKSKQLENAESTLSYVYFIIFSKKWQTNKIQYLIMMRLHHLIKTINQPNRNEYRKITIELLARKCLSESVNRFVNCLNTMLLQYNVTSTKKNQPNVGITLNPQSNKASIFIEKTIRALIFLNLVLFAINPTKSKNSLVLAMVLDSHSLEDSTVEAILEMYEKIRKSEKIKWKGNETQILKYSRRYDTLQIFYEDILKKTEANSSETQENLLSFQTFSREWCAQQTNYQWLSDLKASRIRLLALKCICMKIQEEFKS